MASFGNAMPVNDWFKMADCRPIAIVISGTVFAQTIHALSFGLFHMIAMRVIFQNFSAGQQGRGQALYSTMWGLGVASGSILAGRYWDQVGGTSIFIAAALSTLLGLLLVFGLPSKVELQKQV